MDDNFDDLKGLAAVSVLSGIGFGIWMVDIGAGIFMATAYFGIMASLAELTKRL